MKNLGFAGGLVFLFVVFMAVPKFMVAEGAYLASVLSLGAMLVLIGMVIVGRPLGILVNERNLMSLTRFQTVLWTVLIAASFSTLLLGALYKGQDPKTLIDEAMRPDLLALMGISYASAVTATAMHASKQAKDADDDAVRKSKAINGPVADEPDGVLYRNVNMKQAAITDMFEGDEVADAHLVDMAKVQMFFFTIVSAAYFISRMWKAPVTVVPELPTNLIALMGISHAGYLGSKAITKTPVAEPGAQPQPQPQVAQAPQAQPNIMTMTQPAPVPPPPAKA